MEFQNKIENYKSIDEILGNEEGRYFGHGFKKVKYLIHNVIIELPLRIFKASADILYPVDWSQKRKQENIKPHLSSIDLVFLNCHLIEIIANSCFSLNEEEKERILFRKIEIKTDSLPQESLINIPIEVKSFKIYKDVNGFYKNCADLEVVIGGMRLFNIIEFDGCEKKGGCYVKDSIHERILLPYSLECLKSCDFSRMHLFNEISLDLQRKNITAKFMIKCDSKEEIKFLTPIESIIASAQLAQALIYRLDNLNRVESDTLWMRNISMETLTLFKDTDKISVEVRIKKDKSIRVNGEVWRIYKVLAQFASTRGIFTVAHKMPINHNMVIFNDKIVIETK